MIKFEFDCYLGPYPQEKHKIWCEISNYLNEETINKLSPVQKYLYSTSQEYEKEEERERKLGLFNGRDFDRVGGPWEVGR